MGILSSAVQAALPLVSLIPYFICVVAIPVIGVGCFLRRRLSESCYPIRAANGAASEKFEKPKSSLDAPVSVNYFPSRECNYACGFCFHTNTSGYILPLDEAKRGLRLLKEAGMRKLNIAGGEPFLHPKFLGEVMRYSKEQLEVESISIVSNGSKIQKEFFHEYGRYLDILAISCDSFMRETNMAIGRSENGQADDHITQVFRIAQWCTEYGIMFKLNTVVNIYNWDEDMTGPIAQLMPFRWKVFQCLIVEGENDDDTRVRDARKFLISEEQWKTFCDRHKHLPSYVPEDNQTMAGSYLLLDERMRFLDKGNGPMKKSDSLLDVGVKKAMQQVAWDKAAFDKRGGIYEWRKPQIDNTEGGCGGSSKELECCQVQSKSINEAGNAKLTREYTADGLKPAHDFLQRQEDAKSIVRTDVTRGWAEHISGDRDLEDKSLVLVEIDEAKKREEWGQRALELYQSDQGGILGNTAAGGFLDQLIQAPGTAMNPIVIDDDESEHQVIVLDD